MTNTPDIGDPFPAFALPTGDGGTARLGDYARRKLVVFFYPKDDTPGCTSENQDFSAHAGEFAAAGVALLGVSRDSAARHAKFAAKHGLAHPLASDEAGALSDALGIWTEKSLYGRVYMGMERTTFMVGADGDIVQVWRKVKVKGHAAAVLAAAK